MLPIEKETTARTPLHTLLDNLIEWSAASLYLIAVLFVIALAIRTVGWMISHLVLSWSYSGVLTLLDPLLFLLMLAELLHTLAITLKTHHLPLRPLLALIFMALLRHGVVLASTTHLNTGNAFATLIGLLIFTVLLEKVPSHDAD